MKDFPIESTGMQEEFKQPIPWVAFRSINNSLSQLMYIPGGHRLGKSQLLGKHLGNPDLARADTGIRRNHRAGGKIHSLSHHVFPE